MSTLKVALFPGFPVVLAAGNPGNEAARKAPPTPPSTHVINGMIMKKALGVLPRFCLDVRSFL